MQAAQHLLNWATSQKIPGFQGEILKEPGHTPLLYLEIDPTNK